jgi:hypothetical protein
MRKLVLALCLSLLANPAAAFVLDTVSSVTVAYSVRQLKTGVVNPLQVTCTDSTTHNAIFTSGFVDVSDITTFCGGHGGGYTITTWYDQSGNAINMSPHSGSSLTLTSSGIGSHPSIVFNGSSLFENLGVSLPVSWISMGVVSTASNTTQFILMSDSTSPQMGQYLRYDANTMNAGAFNTVGGSAFANQSATITGAHTISVIASQASQNITSWIDTVASSPVSLTGTFNSGTAELQIGSDHVSGSIFTGNMSEIILIGSASTTDRGNIESDQRTTFGFVAATGGPMRTLLKVGK